MASRKAIILLVVSLLALLAGCNDAANVVALEKKTAALEQQLTAIEQRLEEAEHQISLGSMNDLLRTIENFAYLTPGASGYSVIRTDLGMLTVSLENIQAYANGSKVTLKFGNLIAGTINGLNATLEWGKVDANGKPENETAKSRKVTFVEPLNSGSWTRSNVVLEGVQPAELGFVRVKDVGHAGVRLSIK